MELTTSVSQSPQLHPDLGPGGLSPEEILCRHSGRHREQESHLL